MPTKCKAFLEGTKRQVMVRLNKVLQQTVLEVHLQSVLQEDTARVTQKLQLPVKMRGSTELSQRNYF